MTAILTTSRRRERAPRREMLAVDLGHRQYAGKVFAAHVGHAAPVPDLRPRGMTAPAVVGLSDRERACRLVPGWSRAREANRKTRHHEGLADHETALPGRQHDRAVCVSVRGKDLASDVSLEVAQEAQCRREPAGAEDRSCLRRARLR